MAEEVSGKVQVHDQTRPSQAEPGAMRALRGTGRVLGATGRNLWGPIIGLGLVALAIAIGTFAFFFLAEAVSAEVSDQVLGMATQLMWIAAIVFIAGATILAIDIYGKHMRDGPRGRR